MIVIDVGCARHGNDYSVERLLEMFPTCSLLLGFDPWATPEMFYADNAAPNFQFWNQAAWTYDGEVRFDYSEHSPLVARISEDSEAVPVVCMDLGRFIDELPDEPIVLKIDAEGAEYELLEHLITRGTLPRLSRLLVEWHPRGDGKRRQAIERAVRAAGVVMEQWRW